MIYLLIANEADLQKHKQGIAERAQPFVFCIVLVSQIFRLFWENPWNWKFQRKQASNPGNSVNLYVWHLLEIPREYPLQGIF